MRPVRVCRCRLLQVFPVEFEQIECAMHGTGDSAVAAAYFNTARVKSHCHHGDLLSLYIANPENYPQQAATRYGVMMLRFCFN